METKPDRIQFAPCHTRNRRRARRHSAPAAEPATRRPSPAGDQATIGKGLFIKGEITGTESLYIDGKVEGSINLPGNRVTVGRNGQVGANITAREIVVLGKVRGNVSASDRVDIRAEGALNGDVAAARISIEDGAFFKGGIDIKQGRWRNRGTVGQCTCSGCRSTSTPEAAKDRLVDRQFGCNIANGASASAGALLCFVPSNLLSTSIFESEH